VRTFTSGLPFHIRRKDLLTRWPFQSIAELGKHWVRPTFGEKPQSFYLGRQVMSIRTGMSFLMGSVRSEGGSILKSESFTGIVPVIRVSLP
jgi:hypothetical protein